MWNNIFISDCILKISYQKPKMFVFLDWLEILHFINLTLLFQMLKIVPLLNKIILFFRIITFTQNYN